MRESSVLRRKARQSGESEMRMKLGNDPGSSTGNTQSSGRGWMSQGPVVSAEEGRMKVAWTEDGEG